MDMMEQDNNKKKINIKLPKFITATFVLSIAIVIVLIFVIYLIIKNINVNVVNNEYKNINVTLNKTEDENIINFVNKYFLARNQLDFDTVYKSFNKDHTLYKGTEDGKKYDNGILYEKNYVKSYDNVVVYDVDGLNDNEKVLFITYDISFYFSKEKITSLITTYLVKDNDSMYFIDSFDIGQTKYLDNLMDNKDIKNLYNDVKNKLEKTLENDTSLKLVYNSLRQYDINPDRNMFSENEAQDEKE